MLRTMTLVLISNTVELLQNIDVIIGQWAEIAEIAKIDSGSNRLGNIMLCDY
jgi:hypothetical protein